MTPSGNVDGLVLEFRALRNPIRHLNPDRPGDGTQFAPVALAVARDPAIPGHEYRGISDVKRE
jgi:hypothetical protein